MAEICGQMRIDYQNLTQYVSSPPKLEEICGEVLDQRRKERGKILIIIPSYKDNERLSMMFERLRQQRCKLFDVVVVYAASDKWTDSKGLSVLHVKRKKELGFAGAVYLGQLLALKDKYKYYLMTDVDKYPHSKDSFALLYSNAEKGYDYVRGKFTVLGAVYPFNKYVAMQKPLTPSWLWPVTWGLIRTDTLRKTGLYPLPLYVGSDDIEFHCRMRKAKLRELELDRVLCETYSPFLRLFKLVKHGGYDRIDQYQMCVMFYNMPHAYFDEFYFRKMGLVENLAVYASIVPFYFLANSLLLRCMEARCDGKLSYRAMAKRRLFAAPFWSGLESIAEIRASKAAPMHRHPPKIESRATFSASSRLFSAMFDKPQLEVDRDFMMALQNRMEFADPTGSKRHTLVWKVQLSLLQKTGILAQSIADTAWFLAIACKNKFTGEHMFDGYALGIVKNVPE